MFIYVGIPLAYRELLKVSLRRKAVKANAVVLTFDDGPGSRLTPVILDILRKHNVKATFFLLGRNIVGREHIVRRIADEGHEICSHGYDHLHCWKVSPIRALHDIKRGWRAIDIALQRRKGAYSFRPPYGKLNIVCLLYLLIHKVPIPYWTLDLGDTCSSLEQFNTRKLNVFEELKKTGILLAHDFDRSDSKIDEMVLESVSRILTTTQKEGLQIITMLELFNRRKNECHI